MTNMTNPADVQARRWLLTAASIALTFGVLHHIDHILRGNHVGWPLTDEVNAFTYSLGMYVFVIPGLWLTVRGRLGAGFWLAVAVAGLATAGPTHIGPWAVEPVGDIIEPWADPLNYCTVAPANRVEFFKETYAPIAHPGWAVLAVSIMVSLLVSLVVLVATSIRVRRLVGHW